MPKNCSIIIVTNNSEDVLPKAMKCLQKQTSPPGQILIVDSGSIHTDYLEKYKEWPNVEIVIGEKDMGFCRANNLGYQSLDPQCKYLLFLNPDAYLEKNFLESACNWMNEPNHKQVAILTSSLYGYDIHRNTPNGLYDSTGVFQTWYGRWYDRGQGEKISLSRFTEPEIIPAICGALMFCRKKALDEVLIRECEVFDATFYMYKEDIDLSLRLRKKGWKLQYQPSLYAYHCRGWSRRRHNMPRDLRLRSAKNELKLHARYCHKALPYSLLKYLSVKLLDA